MRALNGDQLKVKRDAFGRFAATETRPNVAGNLGVAFLGALMIVA